MDKSKEAKTSEREDGVDLISNLPDHVPQLILSRLQGTEEVIRTSILSRRWSYLWTSVPSIDIDYSRGLKPLKEWDRNRFKDFIDWVLRNKPLELDSFRLWCTNCYNMSTITRWIHAAVVRKVKLLDLMFCPIDDSEDIQVPHSLVTCGSLEVLKLWLLGCQLCLPDITGFQSLRVLELREVDLLGDNLAKYFLESCPLLEDLSLIDCPTYELDISCPKLKSLRIDTREHFSGAEDDDDVDEWTTMCFCLVISCPKLVFLKLRGYVAHEFVFENLHSLEKAVMHPRDLFLYQAPSYDLFARFSHVESLSIGLYFVQKCFCPTVDAPIHLPNLKTLELTVDDINMDELIRFLTYLPDLESLHLIIPEHIYLVHEWKLD